MRRTMTSRSASGELGAPAAVEVAAFRIASEAITNVVRHAAATRPRPQRPDRGALILEITDNGTGIAPQQPRRSGHAVVARAGRRTRWRVLGRLSRRRGHGGPSHAARTSPGRCPCLTNRDQGPARGRSSGVPGRTGWRCWSSVAGVEVVGTAADRPAGGRARDGIPAGCGRDGCPDAGAERHRGDPADHTPTARTPGWSC